MKEIFVVVSEFDMDNETGVSIVWETPVEKATLERATSFKMKGYGKTEVHQVVDLISMEKLKNCLNCFGHINGWCGTLEKNLKSFEKCSRWRLM